MKTKAAIEFLQELYSDLQYKDIHYSLGRDEARKLEDLLWKTKLLHDGLMDWKENN